MRLRGLRFTGLRSTGLRFTALGLAIGVLLACGLPAISARAAGPSADYKISEQHTAKSPDGATTIEEYFTINKDGDYIWQFWARRSDSMTEFESEQEFYPADFRFTHDSRWAVRMQKTGSGEQSLFLYKLGPQGFAAATPKPLSDLAWNYFFSRPENRKIKRPEFHIDAGLLKGTDDNYSWLAQNWPDSRYLLITLSGEHGVSRTIRGWRCRYDLEQGRFDVPAIFARDNAKAIAPE
jgi:hypothetical protein